MPMSMEELRIWELLSSFAKEDLKDSRAVVQVGQTGDSMFGIVRSKKFAGVPERERQLRVWRYLLAPERRAVVPPISWIVTEEI